MYNYVLVVFILIVLVQTDRKRKGIALIKYIGLMMDKLTQYVGLELVEAIPNGHNGTINGCLYFDAKKGHGFHCKVTSIIRKLNTSELIDQLPEALSLLNVKEKYIQKLESCKLGIAMEPSVTHTDLPSFNMPKRNSLSPTPISPTGWNETPIFSVVETKTDTNPDEEEEVDNIQRPVIMPLDSVMTVMSDADIIQRPVILPLDSVMTEVDNMQRPVIEAIDSVVTAMSDQIPNRSRSNSESMTMMSKSISTDHEFSLSATVSSSTAKTPQVSSNTNQKRLLKKPAKYVQPPPRPNKKNRKNKRRPTPQAPPKPSRPPYVFSRSASTTGSSVHNKKKLLPKKNTRLLQSSTSFERGVHMTSYSDDSVKRYNGVQAYQRMMDLRHENLPSLTEISNNIIKGK